MFVFDPNPIAFYIPILNRPIAWYGILFAVGCLLTLMIAQFLYKTFLETHFLHSQFKNKEEISSFHKWSAEKGFLYAVVGAVIGARLFHIFFYDWPYFKHHLLEILMTWEGGLASHGAVFGVIMAIFLFTFAYKKKLRGLNALFFLDLIAVSIGIAAFFIRMGNFINQEVVGVMTTLPIGIRFGHPAGGEMPLVMRHPVQLYEGIYYLIVGFLLCVLFYKMKAKQKNGPTPGNGFFLGLYLILTFSFRLVIESLKLEQSMYQTPFMNMGAFLSIPIILLGVLIMGWSFKTSKNEWQKKMSV